MASSNSYQAAVDEAKLEPEAFWRKAAAEISWIEPFDRVFDRSAGPLCRWYPGGVLNTCYNAIDFHVEEGRGQQAAVIYDSPVTATKRTLTYKDLLDQVSQFGGLLTSCRVNKGDRVVIYMPVIPETLVAMCACARIGAIHSVVFGGFAARELAARIDDAKPKVVLSASCGIEGARIVAYKQILDEALKAAAHRPELCIIKQRPQQTCDLIAGRDLDWDEAVAGATPVGCVPVISTDPLYILYTSGTTGRPKGVVRDNGGHAVALKWSMRNVYGVRPGDVFWAASDFGWAVGHSYIVYGPLLYGCTTVVHEGKPVGTPDPGNFWRVIEEHGVKVLFTAPTAIRAIKREDPHGKHFERYDASSLRYLFLAGERLDPDTYHWARKLLQRPVVDHWWQTETGWPVASNCMGIEPLPFKPGSPTKPVPGYQIEILDEQGRLLPTNRQGSVAIRLPLPPGSLSTLWDNESGLRETYLNRFPGYYLTGDGGYIDDDGYLYVMGRVDDVIIVAGHNLSTGSIEEVIANHADVAECAVFGVKDALKARVPLALVVLKSTVQREHAIIEAELIDLVRQEIGPVANLKQIGIVRNLPKTRSGKLMRSTMRRIADSEPFQIPPTIDDPSVLCEIEATLQKLGYASAAIKTPPCG